MRARAGDADLVENFGEIEGKWVVAGPLGEDTDTEGEDGTTTIGRGGEELPPGHLFVLLFEGDGCLDLRKLGFDELGLIIALC